MKKLLLLLIAGCMAFPLIAKPTQEQIAGFERSKQMWIKRLAELREERMQFSDFDRDNRQNDPAYHTYVQLTEEILKAKRKIDGYMEVKDFKTTTFEHALEKSSVNLTRLFRDWGWSTIKNIITDSLKKREFEFNVKNFILDGYKKMFMVRIKELVEGEFGEWQSFSAVEEHFYNSYIEPKVKETMLESAFTKAKDKLLSFSKEQLIKKLGIEQAKKNMKDLLFYTPEDAKKYMEEKGKDFADKITQWVDLVEGTLDVFQKVYLWDDSRFKMKDDCQGILTYKKLFEKAEDRDVTLEEAFKYWKDGKKPEIKEDSIKENTATLDKDGNRHGVWVFYYSGSNKKCSVTYNHGVKEGEYRQWDTAGKLVITGGYKNNKRHGSWTFNDDIPYCRVQYNNGLREEVYADNPDDEAYSGQLEQLEAAQNQIYDQALAIDENLQKLEQATIEKYKSEAESKNYNPRKYGEVKFKQEYREFIAECNKKKEILYKLAEPYRMQWEKINYLMGNGYEVGDGDVWYDGMTHWDQEKNNPYGAALDRLENVVVYGESKDL